MKRTNSLRDKNYQRSYTKKLGILTSHISIKEIKFVVKNLPTKTTQDSDGLSGGFYQKFKEEVIPILQMLF